MYLDRIYGKRATVADYYRRERQRQIEKGLDRYGKATHAVWAIRFARHLVELDGLEDEADIAEGFYYGPVGRLIFDGFEVRVYDDEKPYEWGDIEPTQEQRESLGYIIGVAVRLAGADDDLDEIWGVACGDDDTWRVALSTALEYGFIDMAREAIAERPIVRREN